jgi:hypothetical protein
MKLQYLMDLPIIQHRANFYDVWSGLTINGQSIPNVTNQFTLQPYTSGIQIGSVSKDH